MSDFDENFGDDFWILLLQRFRLLLLLIQYFDEKFSQFLEHLRLSLLETTGVGTSRVS